MAHKRIPAGLTPEQESKYKSLNYQPVPTDDKVRCPVCRFFYWRLWFDRAQCLGCRTYLMLEAGKGKDLRAVAWVAKAIELTHDHRVHCPGCARTEYTLRQDVLKCRWCARQFGLKPVLTGTWALVKLDPIPASVVDPALATKLVSRSTIYRQIKKAERKSA